MFRTKWKKRKKNSSFDQSSTRNPNEKNDIMILAIAKSVHFSSSKHFSNVYRCHVGWEKARKSELGNDVGTRDGDTLACGQQRGTEKEREILFGHFSRDYSSACLRTTLYLYLSLFLSVDSFLTHVERR